MFFKTDKSADKSNGNQPAEFIRVVETDGILSGLSAKDFDFGGLKAPLVLAFISPHVNFNTVTSALQQMAGTIPVVAVSTAGELCSCTKGPLYKPTGEFWDSVIVQIFPPDLFAGISIHSVPLHNEDLRNGGPTLKRDNRIGRIVKSLEDVTTPFLLNAQDTFALTFIDGLSFCENYFMEAVYRSGRFPCLFIGGSAGGKRDFKNTFIYDGSRILENHAVIVFLKMRENRSYGVLKSQNFQKTGKSFIVIEADTDKHLVSSVIDPVTEEVRPFAHVLADSFKTTPAELATKLEGYNFGIEIEKELFVRSVNVIYPETGIISFFCDINPGDKLELLKATDFVEQSKRDLAAFLKDRPQPLGAILNDCVQRRASNTSRLAELSQTWPMPAAGFSTFGELFGININQTLTAIVFFDTTETAYNDPFIAAFPIHYARFLNYFTRRIEISQANLIAAKRQLEEDAKKTSAIVDNMLESIVTIDVNGIIKTINKGAEQTFGFTADEAIGKNVSLLMPSPNMDQHDGFVRRYLEAGEVDIVGSSREVIGQRKNGHTFPLSISISKLIAGGDTIFVGVMRDITVQKEKEEKFRLAKEIADTANRAKSEFLANMSHELRTPLNSILGMNRMLQETTLDEEQRGLTDIMFRSSVNLLEIVNDILDLSKIEAGEMKLESIGFDPKYVLDSVAHTLDPVAEEKHVHIQRGYKDEEFPYLLGDPSRLSRIIINLVGNAIKYTDKGHVEIQAFCKEQDALHAEFCCKVIDTGIGIPPNKRESIFEKFVQADTSTTRKYGGTGLGLAITRELVSIMGGKIGVESEEGVGSTFWFVLPFDITDTLHEEKHIRQRKALLGTLPAEKARILVAEDHPMNQILIRKLMEKFGIGQFEIVDNGVQVLDSLKDKSWDIILMDGHMPEKNGYDATKEIRDMEKTTGAHIPIIAMTANAMVGDREKCLRYGMDEYISKPINVDALREILSQWIKFVSP